MRSDAPPLMPIFRSRHQADLLTWLLLHPHREYTVTELAERLDVPLTTLHREVQRLAAAELIRTRSVGRSRLLQGNVEHRAVPALTRLLEVTFGPHSVVEDEYIALAGAEVVLIFGSWAGRYHGAEGGPPGDVDVLVVGAVDRAEVYEAADRAQQRLGLEVNPVIRTSTQWRQNRDTLVREIRSSAAVVVFDRATAA